MLENIYKKEPASLEAAHGGEGTLIFREILTDEFKTALNFLHYTILPPKTSIGFHLHSDTEEVYIVLEGKGTIMVNDMEKAVGKGDVILANPGDSHGLINDSESNLEILVFECSKHQTGR